MPKTTTKLELAMRGSAISRALDASPHLVNSAYMEMSALAIQAIEAIPSEHLVLTRSELARVSRLLAPRPGTADADLWDKLQRMLVASDEL